MSVEIEVGLENATKVKRGPQEEIFLEEPPKGLKSPKVRGLLVVGGLVLLAIAAGLLVYYHNRETTDDAQVDGHITPIASKIYGRVAEVLVTDNQPVKAGQVLVRIDPRDYQANVDQAKAALALAESGAASAGVDVPRTRENVASGTSSADAQLAGAVAALESAQVTYDQARTSDLALRKRISRRVKRMPSWGRPIWRAISRCWTKAKFPSSSTTQRKPMRRDSQRAESGSGKIGAGTARG